MKKIFKGHRIHTIAHNAALNPQKLEAALASPAPHIEVDLTKTGNTLVVAHTPEDYLALSQEEKLLQDPHYIFKKIKESNKIPFLDLKDELQSLDDIASILELIISTKSIMASSNTHELLISLQKVGFTGSIFFSVGFQEALDIFLEKNRGKNYNGKKLGVSIHHSLLSDQKMVHDLKKRGLKIAAWSPYTKHEIDAAIMNGADIITSDNFELLTEVQAPL